jgi:hypothetical protein
MTHSLIGRKIFTAFCGAAYFEMPGMDSVSRGVHRKECVIGCAIYGKYKIIDS